MLRSSRPSRRPAPPASASSSSWRPQAPASLGHLEDLLWLAGPSGLALHTGKPVAASKAFKAYKSAAFELADNEGLQLAWTSDETLAKQHKASVPGLMLLQAGATDGAVLRVPRNKEEFTSEFIAQWFEGQMKK